MVVHTVTSSIAKIQFQQLTLDNDMSQFYSYIIQYKELGQNFTDGTRISHNQNIGLGQTTLHGLNPRTTYVVRVMPFRTLEADQRLISESGWPTCDVGFATHTGI